ncbi:MAG: Kazal-type serine protease inhibitor [Candidatus Binatia bacterium]|nr:Kazal-type serine protease inhibitor [Candidatus Binatia bacterium]
MRFKRIGLRAAFAVAGIIALGGLVQAQGERESGLQITPDVQRVLVSKDVSTERWAITRNLDDLTVTGNVFFPTGGDPLFVFCQQAGTRGADLLLSCASADVCIAAPCGADQWVPLADVELPESFFLPPEAVEAAQLEAAMDAVMAEVVEAAGGLEAAAQATRESGLQFTPDDARTLISKDVGAERWAITRNLVDGSVTGNVFFPSGGPPVFIYCEETAQNGTDLDFDCYSSNLCSAAPCPGEQWELLASVTLPESFFLPDEAPVVCFDPSLVDGGRVCPNNFDPVCGCDGETYSNSCVAEAEGITNWQPGSCSEPVCFDPSLVDGGRVCPNNFDPVCGCDGETYSNSCVAEAEGITNWQPGGCPAF